MTTGKPQQTAADSNSSDDLIAELSKLMAQDAHGNRRDVVPAQPATPPQDFSAPPAPVAAQQADEPAAPFAVRIPGAPALESVGAPPVSHFEFGRPVEPVATVPRQEPSFAPAPVEATPAQEADEPAPFHFDFDLGQRKPPAEPQPDSVADRAPEPDPEPIATDEHDTIADLIAAELMGDMSAPVPPAPAAVEPTPAAPVQLPHVEPVAAAAPPPPKPSEPTRIASWAPTAVEPNLAERAAPARPALRPVNLTPLHKAENPASDSFRIPPVFGLGTTPPPAAPIEPPPLAHTPEPVAMAKPRAEHGYLSPAPAAPDFAPEADEIDAETGRDPIDEIESLIGRAVRVELDSPQEPQLQPRPVAAPALRSLATPTMPQTAPHHPISGADEAILAAAAATGAQVGWVDHSDDNYGVNADEPRRGRERAPRRSGIMRAAAGPVVAVALLLAAGFGLYSVLGLGGNDGPAPVLVADTTPTKQVPEASTAEPGQQSIVFNEMDGVVPGAEEQLVSRDQADLNEVTTIPPTADISEEGLANRKVRTVTVRPDGTIVSGEDSVAGAAILPVDRPNVPVVPGAEAASTSLLANATPIVPTPPVAAAAPVTPLVPGTAIAVVDTAGAPIAGRTAPVPYARPASVGDAPARGPTDEIAVAQPVTAEIVPNAPAASQPASPGVAAQPSTTAAAYAQLSSQRSPEVAAQVARDLAAKYAPLLNGTQLEIVRADLGERGTYYRVRVPAASRDYAAQFCASVTASGGDCIAM